MLFVDGGRRSSRAASGANNDSLLGVNIIRSRTCVNPGTRENHPGASARPVRIGKLGSASPFKSLTTPMAKLCEVANMENPDENPSYIGYLIHLAEVRRNTCIPSKFKDCRA
jgi:hypothetical protein